MTERATIESILKDAYAARLRGDVEGMVRHFADDAVFALAGAREASPVALRCSDCESMRAAMAGLVGAFEFKSHEIVARSVMSSSRHCRRLWQAPPQPQAPDSRGTARRRRSFPRTY